MGKKKENVSFSKKQISIVEKWMKDERETFGNHYRKWMFEKLDLLEEIGVSEIPLKGVYEIIGKKSSFNYETDETDEEMKIGFEV